MLRKFIGYALLVFFLASHSTVCALDKELTTKSGLERIGRDYQKFLNFAGNDAVDCLSIEVEASALFAANFRKTVNNQLVLEGRNRLGHHLWGLREKLGRWKINPDVYPLITATDGFSYITVTFTGETIDRAEPIRLIVIAILKVDGDEKIAEVFEVDHSIEITNS